MKRFFIYFLSTNFLILLVFWGYKFPVIIRDNYPFHAPMILLYIFSITLPIFIGMILRLPTLIKEIKEKRKWSIDWVKLCAIGIPTLYVSLINILYFSLSSVSLPFAGLLVRNSDMPLATIAGVIFGYTVLDSLKEKIQ